MGLQPTQVAIGFIADLRQTAGGGDFSYRAQEDPQGSPEQHHVLERKRPGTTDRAGNPPKLRSPDGAANGTLSVTAVVAAGTAPSAPAAADHG